MDEQFELEMKFYVAGDLKDKITPEQLKDFLNTISELNKKIEYPIKGFTTPIDIEKDTFDIKANDDNTCTISTATNNSKSPYYTLFDDVAIMAFGNTKNAKAWYLAHIVKSISKCIDDIMNDIEELKHDAKLMSNNINIVKDLYKKEVLDV